MCWRNISVTLSSAYHYRHGGGGDGGDDKSLTPRPAIDCIFDTFVNKDIWHQIVYSKSLENISVEVLYSFANKVRDGGGDDGDV